MKKVVIVGGGVAGKNLCATLSKNQSIETILVEPKEYLEVPFAQLRALVEPLEFSPTIRKKYSQLIPTIKHINQKAVGIKGKTLLLEDGKNIDFDYLVLATGSYFPKWPYLKSAEINMNERQKEVVFESNKIDSAKSIIIIGGGTVGVEFAGEIAYHWNDKTIIIINGGSRILGSLSENMSKKAESLLDSMGVKVINNTILKPLDNGSWSDIDGNTYSADLIYQAVGMKIDSNWLNNNPEIIRDEKGSIKVDSSFRVKGSDNIFAIGDITDVPEMKLGAFAIKHATITAKNINSLIKNPSAKLKTYKPSKTMSMVPIGKKKGVVQLPFAHPHFLISIKQKNLFISKVL